ncbi:MAG: HAMP domain-containing protein [Verrucomicrobia bacterium]|nr:HAMP domain-containing protein [Cytophagales bacterium]
MLRLFDTLRAKIFFSFSVFIILVALVAIASLLFYGQRERVGRAFGVLEDISVNTAQTMLYEKDFFAYDAIETNFYAKGSSEYLARHDASIERIKEGLDSLKVISKKEGLILEKDIDTIAYYINTYQKSFKEVVEEIKIRGFKDYGLEGQMRTAAHALEQKVSPAEMAVLLSLRRHEKDYIIRKEMSYVVLLQEEYYAFDERLRAIPQTEATLEKQEFLSAYYKAFNQLVTAEKKIGYSYNDGLKRNLKEETDKIKEKLAYVNQQADANLNKVSAYFTYVFTGVLLAAVLVSLLLSYVLSRQITKPIANLSQHINTIAENKFVGQIQKMPVKGDDEVAQLTHNFNLMTAQIEEYLQDINKKSKVLQKQNLQLQSINMKLIASENKLRSLNSVKDKFFSIISHDLKGPLHTLTGFLQILIKYTNTFTEQELREFAESMDGSVRRLLNMLENLLQWSRSQTGNIEHKPENIRLNEVIEDNISLFKDTAASKQITLLMETEGTLLVKADKNMLDFVLRNLISNALKFTREGGEVKVRTKNLIDFTEIIVSDNGVGISEDDLKKIFLPDVHFSTSGTGKEKGTGFGLLLCKDFVEKNGGEISIESILGIGTSLKFTLPLVHEEITVR